MNKKHAAGCIPKTNLEEAIKCILTMFKEAKDPKDEWHKVEYCQGLRDSLEALRHKKILKNYNLAEATFELSENFEMTEPVWKPST
jgi:hypothetical protein